MRSEREAAVLFWDITASKINPMNNIYSRTAAGQEKHETDDGFDLSRTCLLILEKVKLQPFARSGVLERVTAAALQCQSQLPDVRLSICQFAGGGVQTFIRFLFWLCK